jgi:hypothetical protein
MNPVTAVARGVAASAVGTLAMDSLLYGRYRRDGGKTAFPEWESSAGIDSWEAAPAPARVAKLFIERVSGRELSARYVRPLNNLTHWGYGLFAGAQYGIYAGVLHSPKLRYGIPFGAGVWASGYVILPLLGVYEPIWKYDAKTLGNDLSAHLVFGTTTAGAFQALANGGKA